ncbi:MAG: class I SAM-dependent methyltransferase [Chloroflexota bacterium]
MNRRPFLDALALWIGRVVLAFLSWLLFTQTVVRLVRRYLHFPVPPFVGVLLDSPVRRALQPPEELITRAGVRPGQTVLEVGPGPGTFTVEAARRVLPDGKVIAVDIQPQMLARLRAKAARLGVSNLEVYEADAYHLPVPDASVDLVYMVTVLAEIPDRPRALAEIRRVLKPSGTLSVSEFVLDPDYPRRSTVTRWAEDAGFTFRSAVDSRLWYTANFRP